MSFVTNKRNSMHCYCFREVIIRTAFQSMQLVVTDFLPLISPPCLSLCVEMAAKFGLQHSELNISLTAIGLLVGGVELSELQAG